VHKHEQTGSVSAKPMGGSRGRGSKADREWLLKRIKAQPDLTLQELRHELAEQRGLVVGYGSV
jgi:transposase